MSAQVLEDREDTQRSHLALVADGPATSAARLDPFWTPVIIRPAVAADATPLSRLAHLDSTRPLRGMTVVAEQNGSLVAAVSLDDDRAIADPFRASADLVALLQLRARQLREGRTSPAA